MFAGHVGAALVIGRAERRVNVGVFVFAALLLDVALWSFVLLGRESAMIPDDYASTHQVKFIFPYSHGLVACIAWSVLAGAVAFRWYPRLRKQNLRFAFLVAAAVSSHWILDALVHVSALPLLGAASPKVGLGLWQSMPVALSVEGGIVALGLLVFVPGSGLSQARKIGLVALCSIIFAFTVVGMTVAPPPPSVAAMAISSLVTVIVVCSIASWLGKQPHEKRA